MGQYSKNSKVAGLIIAISVFASLLLFSVFFEFDIEMKLWLVNIFTGLTIGTIIFFFLHLTKKGSESGKLIISIIIALLIILLNPANILPEGKSLDDIVEEELPENVQEEVDTIYEEIEEDSIN